MESSREELKEKRELKRLTFSAGETDKGKPDLQKLLETLLAKDQKELLV